jgi:hypothetical protein
LRATAFRGNFLLVGDLPIVGRLAIGRLADPTLTARSLTLALAGLRTPLLRTLQLPLELANPAHQPVDDLAQLVLAVP